MKYSLIVSLFALSLAATPVFANGTHHPSDLATEKSGSSTAVQPDGMDLMQMHGDMQLHMDKMAAMPKDRKYAKHENKHDAKDDGAHDGSATHDDGYGRFHSFSIPS